MWCVPIDHALVQPLPVGETELLEQLEMLRLRTGIHQRGLSLDLLLAFTASSFFGAASLAFSACPWRFTAIHVLHRFSLTCFFLTCLLDLP